MTESDGFRVLIAGGGVAGLEAALALRALVGPRAEVEILSPEAEFVHRQLAVAEPFSAGEVSRLDLEELVSAAGATLRRGRLGAVRGEERVAITADRAEISYEALLIAIGGRPVEALHGAVTYRDLGSRSEIRQAILDLDHGSISSLLFAVPPTVRWAMPLYELALLCAGHLEEIGDREIDLGVVTHEEEPLELFGPRAGAAVRDLLDEAGVTLRTSSAAASVEADGLRLMSVETIPCDRVVALPRLEIPPLPGVPQGPHGFIGTDLQMRVEGLDDVYAAGDATWFPVKQGGIAAQQADVAASSIASRIDPGIEPRSFNPVLRGALLTHRGPRYLRAALGDEGASSAAAPAPLWWPPAKVAGEYLAPFLASQGSGAEPASSLLEDLERPSDEAAALAGDEHREAIELCLAAAEADARWDDYGGALRWLAAGEGLGITLPSEYQIKREQWRDALNRARVP